MTDRTGLIIVFALGCGGGDPTPSEAITDTVKAGCAKAFECKSSFSSTVGVTFEDVYGTSEADCVMRLGMFTTPAAYTTAVDNGTILYDAGDAKVCLDATKHLTCEQYWQREPVMPPPECDTAFVGTVADGGACTLDDECAVAGSTCNDLVCGP